MTRNLGIWRSGLRLTSALVLLSFVICHLTVHSLLLISFERAETARNILMYPWRTGIGTALLMSAALVHYTNALWSIYLRRSLYLSRWEWGQLSFGLCIPALLMFHVVSTRVAESALDVNSYYSTVLIVQWLMVPWLGVVQMLAVLTVWTHASIGIHFWWRTKPWYPAWRQYFFGFCLLLPTLALAGYVTAGNQVLREAKNPDYARLSLEESHRTDKTLAEIGRIARIGLSIHLALVLLPLPHALCGAGTTVATSRRCWPIRADGPCRCGRAPPCLKPCAKMGSPTRRFAAEERAAPPAESW
jgi:adenylate cyclase